MKSGFEPAYKASMWFVSVGRLVAVCGKCGFTKFLRYAN